ncbi:MAG TPA: MAPEG family protein [Rhizomicrobium sp.]|jgi:glutathione S-transferase|nr:MAPEG family protein [Rhizomicrobium sp.]
MTASLATLLVALVTVIALLVFFWTGFRVGQMRGKHQVKAPATTGHPEFECAYRVQVNMLEQIVIFLPLLWLSNAYFMWMPYLTGALGLVWIVGRIMYATGYSAENPGGRSTGFLIAGIATLGLLITTIIGLVQAYMAISAA